jgi:hypothetical protein
MLKFTKHNARLLRLHRVNSFAIRKAPALNQPLYNDAPPCMYPTSQSPPFLILLLAQLVFPLCISILQLGARLRSLRVVEDDLLVECLV